MLADRSLSEFLGLVLRSHIGSKGPVVALAVVLGSVACQMVSAEEPLSPFLKDFVSYDRLTWEEHWVQQLDGKGGRVCHRAKFRFLPPHEGKMVLPWGLARMDNGEIAVAGVAGAMSDAREDHQTVLAFTSDRGATWSEYYPVLDLASRPMMLVYLGNGELSFRSSWEASGNYQFYSKDYGRTWSERVKSPAAPDGEAFHSEGNLLVDRDEHGVAVLLGETGATHSHGPPPEFPLCGGIHWSRDGGRTWGKFSFPEQWKWRTSYQGKSYERGVCEGGLVRAANGWIVAALRTDLEPRFFPLKYDNMMGTAVSISKDNGETWSELNFVFGPGRMHPTLLRLPNGDLVMTVIRRLDLENGQMASYRRGCDAVVSRDNGLTWDLNRMYILDDFASLSEPRWYYVRNGHQFSIGLGDGSILTTYGNYQNAGALIHWKP